jgi:hypothetical protein
MANTKVQTIRSLTPRTVENAVAANRLTLPVTHAAPGTTVPTKRRIGH